MRRAVLPLAAMLIMSGCLPATGVSSVDIASNGDATLTLTLIPQPHPEGRPRSADDLRTDGEVLAAALQEVGQDPGLCSRLRTISQEFQVSDDRASITCTGTVTVPGFEFRPAAAAVAADLWAARQLVAVAAAREASAGYAAAPEPDRAPYAADPVQLQDCAAGDRDACLVLYEDSPEGSWYEVVALLGLRDDLRGAAPVSWPDEPLTVTQTVRTPAPVLDHNGTLQEDGRTVSWQFEVTDPEETPTNLFVVWEQPPAEQESGGVQPLLVGLAVLVLLAGSGYATLLTYRRYRASLASRQEKPKVRRLSKPKKRRKL